MSDSPGVSQRAASQPGRGYPLKESNILAGAKEIAAYCFGDADKWSRIIDLNRRHREPHRFPMFYLGSTLCARKSEIDAWIARREAANCNTPPARHEAA